MEDAKNSAFNRYKFARCIGSLSGFHFPLNDDIAILRVNRQMREEALPLAYRRTTFELYDWDELITLLLSIGQIGRDNIEALRFSIRSPMHMGSNWAGLLEDDHTKEPHPHVMKCAQLLKQCKRLEYLNDSYLEFIDMDGNSVEQNLTIEGIYSLRVLRERIGICESTNGLPAEVPLAQWLKIVM